METSLKTGFAQIFSCCSKIWVAQTLGELQAARPPPPSPRARAPMFQSRPSHTEAKELTAISYTDCT